MRLPPWIVRTGATFRVETRLSLLSASPWVVGGVLAALGVLTVLASPDRSSFRIAWALSNEIGPLIVAPLLLFLAAGSAYRPFRHDLSDIQDSKVAASEELLLGRWLGLLPTLILPLAIQYGATIAAQAYYGKNEIQPIAYLHSLARLVPPVLLLSMVAFMLVTLTRVLILGAGLAGLAWFALFFGQEYVPSALRLTYSQNGPLFLGLTLAALLFMLLAHQPRRRARRSRLGKALALLVALVFSASVLRAGWASLAMPGKRHVVDVWRRLKEARRAPGAPVPNFAWTDQYHRRVSLADWRGRPVLLVFFQPADQKVVPLLRRLHALRLEFPPDRLGLLTVCLSEDLNAGEHAAAAAGVRIPVLPEWGAVSAGGFDRRRPPSAAAWALDVKATPSALLLDADGKRVPDPVAVDDAGWQSLRDRLRRMIAGEGSPAEPGQ